MPTSQEEFRTSWRRTRNVDGILDGGWYLWLRCSGSPESPNRLVGNRGQSEYGYRLMMGGPALQAKGLHEYLPAPASGLEDSAFK